MPSTFFGLNIASSAMSAFQTAVNTTANNVANVQTEGYSKQVANREAGGALRVWQRYGTIGTGVITTSITSARSVYYDTKYWENQASLGFYNTKVNFLNQIENYFEDEEDVSQGFTTIFSNLFNQMNELSSNAGDENVRQNVISQAQIFTSYFHDVGEGLNRIQEDCNEQIKVLVDTINSCAEKIAALTKQINSIEIQGGTANELRDQRAMVMDELAEIVPVSAIEAPVANSNYPDMYTGGTTYVVKLDGQTLVDSYEYRTLSCVARENKINQTDVDGLYNIIWTDTEMNFNATATSMEGSLKGLFEIRDGNNAENFQGRVTESAGMSVTIKPSTMTTVESMSLASSGTLTIKNKAYNYTSFEAEVNDEGEIVSYTFTLEKGIDADASAGILGRSVSAGTVVDFMGIPYYMAQMSEFIRSFAGRFNAYQQSGEDLNGDPMGSFFIATKFDGTEYDFSDHKVSTDGKTDSANSIITSTSDSYYQLTALNFNVADASLRDSAIFSTTASVSGGKIDAHEIIDKMLCLQEDDKLFRGGSASGFLKCIISDISIDTSECQIFQTNFTEICDTITNQRLSISGVDEDEEALDIVKFQNAYNLSAKMVQCMSEIYDKLINETGV